MVVLWLAACVERAPTTWTVERVQFPLGSILRASNGSGRRFLSLDCPPGSPLYTLDFNIWPASAVADSYRLDDEMVSATFEDGGDGGRHWMRITNRDLKRFREAKRLRLFPQSGEVDFDMTTFGPAVDRLLAEGGCTLPTR